MLSIYITNNQRRTKMTQETQQEKVTFNLPINAVTERYYSAGNIAKLLDSGFLDQKWATFNQWRNAGYKVIKGSKGTELIKIVTVKDKKDPKLTKRVPKRFYVFNIEQVEERA